MKSPVRLRVSIAAGFVFVCLAMKSLILLVDLFVGFWKTFLDSSLGLVTSFGRS